MPIVKYIAIHNSPMSLLKYMTKKSKTENALVSGINCSDNIQKVYDEMKWLFEFCTGERFFKKSLELKSDDNKETVRLHHYIQSFKPGEVSAAEAHEIAKEWAAEAFGKNRPVLIATHIDKGHIHNHIAVCPFDYEKQRWRANKTTLKECREKSDKIAKLHGLSVIEHPKYRANHKYKENAERKKNTSWKQRLCDDIDEIICMPSVKSIDDLVSELEKKRYSINKGKYLTVKPKGVKNGIRTYRLGDGYALEHLEYRINNKDYEMPLSEVLKYDGVQRNYAMCIRQIQIEINRKPEKDRLHLATYRDVLKTLDVLNFVTDNGIRSVTDFEKTVSKADEKVNQIKAKRQEILDEISEQKQHIADIPVYLALKYKRPLLSKDIEELKKYRALKLAGVTSEYDDQSFRDEISRLEKQLAKVDAELGEANAEYTKVKGFFDDYTENMKSDYQVMLERTKAEIEAQKEAEERIQREKEEAEIRKQQEEYYKNYTPPSEEEWR